MPRAERGTYEIVGDPGQVGGRGQLVTGYTMPIIIQCEVPHTVGEVDSGIVSDKDGQDHLVTFTIVRAATAEEWSQAAAENGAYTVTPEDLRIAPYFYEIWMD